MQHFIRHLFIYTLHARTCTQTAPLNWEKLVLRLKSSRDATDVSLQASAEHLKVSNME